MDSLDAILEASVAHGHDTADKLLGAAFIVVNGKDVVYRGAAGRIRFDPASTPFAPDSFSWVASLTKLVTATCLMQLVERGEIGLDDDVRALLPELGRLQILRGFDQAHRPLLQDNAHPISLRMLCTHTVGTCYAPLDPRLIEWCQQVGHPIRQTDWSIDAMSIPLLFAPGHGWVYGTSLDWAGLLLERITKQSLGQYMQAHIFDPLDMSDTGFWPEKLPQTASRTVAWSHRHAASLTLEPADPITPEKHEIESGGAGLYSTADDYARFLRAFLAGTLVSEATMRTMFSPQLNQVQKEALKTMAYHAQLHRAMAPEFPPGLDIDHGISGFINLQDVPGKRPKGSLMWSGMCNSHWWIDRQTGIAAVLVVNVVDTGDSVVVRLYDELERAVYAHGIGGK
ncbi:hypothetical protein XA68_10560 [Ophiocordyceps unilateralis]|uniref:Beta-lactamase-related domain-containing protein n=1 Tax=Ophiocordyceps unilateralis TaxID=268505 RepID=A0A2A9NYW6_OPHUN|nr:hypothetical protein XA68_10560 [Ophiocordyceps unilateralis]